MYSHKLKEENARVGAGARFGHPSRPAQRGCRCDVFAVNDKGERLFTSATGTVSSLDL